MELRLCELVCAWLLRLAGATDRYLFALLLLPRCCCV
jgi:hypothetical protein